MVIGKKMTSSYDYLYDFLMTMATPTNEFGKARTQDAFGY